MLTRIVGAVLVTVVVGHGANAEPADDGEGVMQSLLDRSLVASVEEGKSPLTVCPGLFTGLSRGHTTDTPADASLVERLDRYSEAFRELAEQRMTAAGATPEEAQGTVAALVEATAADTAALMDALGSEDDQQDIDGAMRGYMMVSGLCMLLVDHLEIDDLYPDCFFSGACELPDDFNPLLP
jgi:hypothetical protein